MFDIELVSVSTERMVFCRRPWTLPLGDDLIIPRGFSLYELRLDGKCLAKFSLRFHFGIFLKCVGINMISLVH